MVNNGSESFVYTELIKAKGSNQLFQNNPKQTDQNQTKQAWSHSQAARQQIEKCESNCNNQIAKKLVIPFRKFSKFWNFHQIFKDDLKNFFLEKVNKRIFISLVKEKLFKNFKIFHRQ